MSETENIQKVAHPVYELFINLKNCGLFCTFSGVSKTQLGN